MSCMFRLKNEDEMLSFGTKLSQIISAPCVIYLRGVLGAGKTTLVRGFLRGLQYEGVVKSPTYTFIEPYFLSGKTIYHLDLYRIRDARELDFLGVDELEQSGILFIEWPEQGAGHLPKADITCLLEVIDVNERSVSCEAKTAKGESILNKIGVLK